MKIRFTTSVAGARAAYHAKKVYDLAPRLALRFLRAGHAVPVADEAEAATLAPDPETGTRRRSRKRPAA
jgi:hypothetical protein